MKKEENKTIPLKNYIYVVIMFFIVVLIVLGLRAWYRNYKEYKLQIPVIEGQIQQIDIEELNEYIIEHDDFFMYIGTVSNKNCRAIEKDLVKVLTKRNIKDETIYLNMSNISNDKKKLNDKLKSLGFDYNDAEYPMFLIVNGKKITSIVYRKDSKINIGNIEQLLDESEIGA